MRSFQFWILMLGSTMVSALMLKQISLSRSLNGEQHQLLDSQAVAASAAEYSNAWQTLAMHIYQSSRQDPAFAAILKQAAVDVRSSPMPGTSPTSAPTAVLPTSDSMPPPGPAPSKPSVTP